MELVKKSTTFHVFLKESFTVQLWDHLRSRLTLLKLCYNLFLKY